MALYSNTVASTLPVFSLTRLHNQVTAAAQQISFGQLTLTVTGTAWLPIALTNTTCPFLTLSDLADTAATAAGFTLNGFDHIVYNFPFTASCGWKGLATVGGIPSRAWLNGFWDVKTGIHEIVGHNLGLLHSHSCRTLGPLVVTQPCAIEEYGDWLDTMGISPIDPVTAAPAYPHFNATQKARLGWIGALGPPITDVLSSGVYRIGPYAVDTDVPLALRLPYQGQPGWDFYVEARQPFGSDAFLVGFPSTTDGVVLHLTDPSDGTTSYLLDAHPLTSSWQDAVLRVGEVFDQADAGFALRVLEANTSGATVAVDLASDVIGLTLLSPWQAVWHYGDVLRIDVLVQVGTQPAEGGLWEWAVTIPTGEFFLEPSTTLGPDGIWTLGVPLTTDLPIGWYTIYGRATWQSKVTPIAWGQFLLQ